MCKISLNTLFIPASNRSKNEAGKAEIHQSGGKVAVENWITRFSKFSAVFSGLTDKDAGNNNNPDLNIISRYSIENYLSDPIVLFTFLNHSGEQHRKPIEHFNISIGTNISWDKIRIF